MANKRPIITYIISILNAFVPPLIAILLGASYVYVTVDTETNIRSTATFAELYFTGLLLGIYLCMTASAVYYYLVLTRKLKPRWWTNFGLIIAGYGIIYLTAMLMGSHDKVENAISLLADDYWKASGMCFVAFIVITLVFRTKPNQSA